MKTLEQRISILEKRILKEGRKGDFQVGDLVGNTVIGFDFKVVKFLKSDTVLIRNIKNGKEKDYQRDALYKPMNSESKKRVTEAVQKVLGSRIKVYDNGGKSLDRITIVFLDFELENNRFYQAIAADESGHGFYSHTSVQLGRHLGKEIPFSSLSPFIQKEVTEEIKEYNSYNESKVKKRVKEDHYSYLGGETPYSDSEMRNEIVDKYFHNKNYVAYHQFQDKEYESLKKEFKSELNNWKSIYRSSNYQGHASINPEKNIIVGTILNRGGVMGVIYVLKESKRVR